MTSGPLFLLRNGMNRARGSNHEFTISCGDRSVAGRKKQSQPPVLTHGNYHRSSLEPRVRASSIAADRSIRDARVSAGSVRDMEPINAPSVLLAEVGWWARAAQRGPCTFWQLHAPISDHAPTQLPSFVQACPSTNQPFILVIYRSILLQTPGTPMLHLKIHPASACSG
jgi:hypothetical protein